MACGWINHWRFVAFVVAVALSVAGADLRAAIRISPSAVVLNRPEGSQQLLVTETLPDGRSRDVTRVAGYQISAAAVATVDSAGLVRPLADGAAEIIIRLGTDEARVPITVHNLGAPQPVSFQYD